MVKAVGTIGSSSEPSQVQSVQVQPKKAGGQGKVAESSLENLPASQVKAKLAQAVKSGALTQAQADAMLRRIMARQAQAQLAAASSEGAAAPSTNSSDTPGADKSEGVYSPNGTIRESATQPQVDRTA
jgi:hypothetical protein